MNQREWLRAFCPEETLILSIDPGLGLSQTASQQLKRALTSEGCDVVDDTPEMREKFLNPESGEWVREHYKGAFIGSASIGVESDNGEDLLAITVGWYKGRMTAKAEVVAFRWDGARWVARTDLKVIRVS